VDLDAGSVYLLSAESNPLEARDRRGLTIKGRLKPGATISQSKTPSKGPEIDLNRAPRRCSIIFVYD